MIEKLFEKTIQSYQQGKVISVNNYTNKATVKTSSGLSMLVSYNTDIEVGDTVIVAGTSTKFVVQKIRNFVPNKNTITKV